MWGRRLMCWYVHGTDVIRMGWYWDGNKFYHGVMGGMGAVVAGDGMVWS